MKFLVRKEYAHKVSFKIKIFVKTQYHSR